jgi:hypothetical protein
MVVRNIIIAVRVLMQRRLQYEVCGRLLAVAPLLLGYVLMEVALRLQGSCHHKEVSG